MFLFIFIFLFSSHRHGQAPVSGDSLRFTRPSVRGTVCVEYSTFSPCTCLGRYIGLPLHFCCFFVVCLGRHIGLPLHFWCFLLFAWAGTQVCPLRLCCFYYFKLFLNRRANCVADRKILFVIFHSVCGKCRERIYKTG